MNAFSGLVTLLICCIFYKITAMIVAVIIDPNHCHMQTLAFSAESGNLPRYHPVAARSTISMIQQQEGIVVELEAGLPGIAYNEQAVLPVNLPEPLREPGIRVIFSGEIKQISKAEFWAALPVVLTDICKL